MKLFSNLSTGKLTLEFIVTPPALQVTPSLASLSIWVVKALGSGAYLGALHHVVTMAGRLSASASTGQLIQHQLDAPDGIVCRLEYRAAICVHGKSLARGRSRSRRRLCPFSLLISVQ